MPVPTKELTLLEQKDTALVPTPDLATQIVAMAANPDLDVAKLEKLIEMQERVSKSQAVAAFNAAFSEMQGELPTITERGEILVNGSLRSKYARYEDIIEVIRPILKKHGFAIRHRNEAAGGNLVVVGILTHKAGHSEEDRFECPPDTSGGKVGIQANGSTRSYGQRYTTIALCGIVTKGQDNDGNNQSEKQEAPKGFEDWWHDLRATGETGRKALSEAFNASKPEYRIYLTKFHNAEWEQLKRDAANVGKAAAK